MYFVYKIIEIMWLAPQKSELLDLRSMDIAAFHGIDTGGIHACVSEDIRKTDDIFL